MTATARARTARNDDSAADATATPSVERNESSCMQKTGTLMTSVEAPAAPANVEPGQLGGPLLATVRRTLIAADTDQATFDDIVGAVAAGQVYQVATASVKEQDGHSVRPFFESLDLIIDHIVTGTPLTTARMAAEALSVSPPAQAGHHPWCLVDQCRANRYDDGEVLTEHQGPKLTADITDGTDTIQLRAELGSDENHVDDHATVFMASNKDDGLMFDEASLDKAIADFEDFVDGLRHLRRVMGQGRTA